MISECVTFRQVSGHVLFFCLKFRMCHFKLIQTFSQFHHLMCMDFGSRRQMVARNNRPCGCHYKKVFNVFSIMFAYRMRCPQYNLMNSSLFP